MMSFVFSVKQTGVPLGGALAGVVVPPLVLLGGWRLGALAVAGLCVLTALVAQAIRVENDADRDPKTTDQRARTVPRAGAGRHRCERAPPGAQFVLLLGAAALLTTYLVTYSRTSSATRWWRRG